MSVSRPNPTALLHAAIDLAASGVPVFPLHTAASRQGCSCGRADCHSPGKHPRVSRGVHAASISPNKIRTWWATWPDANVAAATGNGLTAIDIDGPTGIASLDALQQSLGALPPTTTVATGNGRHLYFTSPTGAEIANSASTLASGIDIRSTGGYVVAPPSQHYSGTYYRYLNDQARADLPSAWLDALTVQRTARPRATTAAPTYDTHVGGHPYGLAALDNEARRVATAAPGSRNYRLNSAAFNLGQLLESAGLDVDQVRHVLANAGLVAGLDVHETAATITSGLTAGQRQPRGVPDRPTSPTPTRQTIPDAKPAGPAARPARTGPVELHRHGSQGWRWTVTHNNQPVAWRTGTDGHGLYTLTKDPDPQWRAVPTQRPFELPFERRSAYRTIIRGFTARPPRTRGATGANAAVTDDRPHRVLNALAHPGAATSPSPSTLEPR